MKQYLSPLKKYFQLPFGVPKTWINHLLEIIQTFFSTGYIIFYFSEIPGWPRLTIYPYAIGLFLLLFTLTAYTVKRNEEFFKNEDRAIVYIVNALIRFIGYIWTFFLCKLTVYILHIINNEYIQLMFIFGLVGLALYLIWHVNGKDLPEQLTVNAANEEKAINETPDKTE